jgi:hypothetical protein
MPKPYGSSTTDIHVYIYGQTLGSRERGIHFEFGKDSNVFSQQDTPTSPGIADARPLSNFPARSTISLRS